MLHCLGEPLVLRGLFGQPRPYGRRGCAGEQPPIAGCFACMEMKKMKKIRVAHDQILSRNKTGRNSCPEPRPFGRGEVEAPPAILA
jgi:hypothetical protein